MKGFAISPKQNVDNLQAIKQSNQHTVMAFNHLLLSLC